MVVLFAATSFLSSALLFLVQPMFARMVLPLLGGTPAVWNTCVVFFQATLLAGYIYAHAAIKLLGVRRQAMLHAVVLVLPLAALPIAVASGWSPPVDANPAPWLLALSCTSVGLPFFVVAASAPMLQRWFAATAHPAARDPYFLYGASNLGSIGALLAYPVLVEPQLRLAEQSRLWTAGYGVLAALVIGCALALGRSPTAAPTIAAEPGAAPPTPDVRFRWVALAFVPSSLMLGVTTYLSTDIVAMPLLWIVPLALYLASFVLTFRARPRPSPEVVVAAMPIVLLLLVGTLLLHLPRPGWLLIPLHLLAFFVTALMCHGELARRRPATAHLTEFYLWLSVGGMLGGLFNTLVAPLVFRGVTEYPMAIALACLLLPAREEGSRPWLDVARPAALGLAVVGLIVSTRTLPASLDALRPALVIGLPVFLCFTLAGRPLAFGLGVAALFLAIGVYDREGRQVLDTERSFFGVLRVTEDPVVRRRVLFHGTTMHGSQNLDADRRVPLTYYHPSGPIGQVFTEWATARAPTEIAVVGLGAGSLASYGRAGQRWTFYEIDPAVARIARDPRYFTFLAESAAPFDVVLGDARRSLTLAPAHRYDLIVLDAFSSDAIPVHLITREAIDLYLAKLAEGGLLAFHVSNRHLRLLPVLARVADAEGLVHRARGDAPTEEESLGGKLSSLWVVMARRTADLGPLAGDPRWTETEPAVTRATALWTDDFSNVLGAFTWR
jgi:hypothetical protein